MPAPSEEKTLAAFQKVQRLGGQDLDARITAEIGNPMLGVFRTLARAVVPEHEVAKVVHCMTLAYLMRHEVEQ